MLFLCIFSVHQGRQRVIINLQKAKLAQKMSVMQIKTGFTQGRQPEVLGLAIWLNQIYQTFVVNYQHFWLKRPNY